MVTGRSGIIFLAGCILFFSGCNRTPCDLKDARLFIEQAELSSFESCLKSGLNPNLTTENKESLLYLSIKKGDHSLVKVLVENGADVFGYTPEDVPVLQYAARNPKGLISQLIVSSQIACYRNADDSLHLGIYQRAIEQGNAPMVEDMITKSGMDVSSKLPNNLLPVPWAAFSNSFEAMQVLLAHGANPDDEFDTRSALIIASMYGSVEIVKLLLEYKADINNYEGTHMTALMFAITNEYPDVVELLLQKNADTSLVDLNGKSARDFAIASNNEAIKAFLDIE
jgi:ankyrin repeat protein